MYNNYCCKEFAEYADRDEYNNGAFVRDVEEIGIYHANGCCGGGCFVIQNMKFCPFCGINLKEMDEI